jgi:hypothetical protein
MVSGNLFEEPFGLGRHLRRSASPSLSGSEDCVCVPAGAEEIDKYPGVKVDPHLMFIRQPEVALPILRE